MASYLILVSAKIALAGRYIRRQATDFREQRLTADEADQFVIVQPILSGDPRLAETLEQNITQLPKEIRFMWMVDEVDLIGIETAQKLASSFANVEVIACPPAGDTENPKTFKLQIAVSRSDRRLFVVLDDDTVIDESSLVAAKQSLEYFDLYTGIPVYQKASTVWGNLVTHFVNNNSVLTYLPLLNFIPPLSINGMFYVCKTEELVKMGGFDPIIHELCDDYAFKTQVVNQGWRIKQGISFQSVATHVSSFRQYIGIMHRWLVFAMLLVKDQSIGIRLTLGMLLGLPPILFLASVLLSMTNLTIAAVLVGFLALRQMMLLIAQRMAGASGLPFHPMFSIVAELVLPVQTLVATVWPTIHWRNRKIRIGKGQKFRILAESDH